MELFAGSIADASQADGAQTIALEQQDYCLNHQLQVEVSAIPAAGTLTVSIKTPGAAGFVDLAPVIDLTSGNQIYTFTRFASHVRLTPTGFDAAKTYSVFHVAGRA